MTNDLRTVTTIARTLTIVVAAAVAVGLAQGPRVGAHDDGTTAHLWLDHIKTMADPGTINDSTNPVDWTKLKGVPTDIADGTDDGVEQPGSGLDKSGNTFSVDPAKAQRRVTGTCPAGRAVKGIDQAGGVTCTKGPVGFSKTIEDTGPMCDNACTEGTLVLNPGTWLITAKLVVYQSDFSEDSLIFDCQLDAGGLSSFSGHLLYDTWGAVTIRMQLIASFDPGDDYHASVSCGDGDVGEARGGDLSIMAIRVTK